MKLLLPPLALLLLVPSTRDEVALAYAPEEGTVLKRSFDAEASHELTEIAASFDGQDLEHQGELPEFSSRFTEHIVVTDRLVGVENGRPTELERTFDELAQENTDTAGEEEVRAELGSDLEGRTVRFRWDEDEENYTVKSADDGDDLDGSVARWLLEDMDLRLVLPGREVEVDEEWELDPRLYLAFMWPSGLLGFHEEGEETDEDERELSGQTIDNLEGSGTARLEEIREEDGVRVAVLHVELEITTGSEHVLPAVAPDEVEEGEFPRPEITVEVRIERKLEGTLLWDLEHGHALSAEFECESSRLHTEKWTVTGELDGEEVSADAEQSRRFEGTIRYSARIERE